MTTSSTKKSVQLSIGGIALVAIIALCDGVGDGRVANHINTCKSVSKE